MKKYIKCTFCDGSGCHKGSVGPRTCLICDGEKYIPAKKGFATKKLDEVAEKQRRIDAERHSQQPVPLPPFDIDMNLNVKGGFILESPFSLFRRLIKFLQISPKRYPV